MRIRGKFGAGRGGIIIRLIKLWYSISVSGGTHRCQRDVGQLPGEVRGHLHGDVTHDVADGRPVGPAAGAGAGAADAVGARAAEANLLLDFVLVQLFTGKVQEGRLDDLKGRGENFLCFQGILGEETLKPMRGDKNQDSSSLFKILKNI